MESVAKEVQKADPKVRSEILATYLDKAKFPRKFRVPVDDRKLFSGIVRERCRYLKSLTVPVWFQLANVERDAAPYAVIFKAGMYWGVSWESSVFLFGFFDLLCPFFLFPCFPRFSVLLLFGSGVLPL